MFSFRYLGWVAEAPYIEWVEARDAAKHPTMLSTAHNDKELSSSVCQ